MKDKKVSEDKIFWLKGGRPIHNLHELVDALHEMDEPVFEHHVTDEKNDFAIWIDKSLGKTELAHQIKNIKEPESIAETIEHHLPPEREKKTKTRIKKKRKIAKETIKSSNKVKRHISAHVTKLHLHHPQEEANKTLAIASYMAIGVVTGVALTILLISLT